MPRVPVPPFWGNLLQRYVKKTFYADTRKRGFAEREEFTEGDFRFFVKGVRQLNEYFTRERGSLPKNYFNQKELRSGYLLYFLPVNALKVAALLEQNFSITPGQSLTILDVGSGPGTGILGGLLWLENYLKSPQPPFDKGGRGGISLRWILIDQNSHALSDAVNLHREITERFEKEGIPIRSEIKTIVADLDSGRIPETESADLILALNTLSEFPKFKRRGIVERLLTHHLKEDGRLFIMEPALQRTTRELMELHDELLSREGATVFAPCLHQAACPMLAANRRDWCHTTIEWERPDWIQRFDHLVGIRKDYLQCSYLLLGTPNLERVLPRVPPAGAHSIPPPSGARPESPAPIWRVVSGNLNSKGKSELLLCGPGGLPDLLRVTRLDRDQSESNRPFDEVQRGEMIKMEKVGRITKGTHLSKIR